VVFWNVGDKHVDKSLALVPARVAIAVQEEGWFVRSEIIWVKPNPIPRSVKDRPTDTYEPILMLTKSRRHYWNPEAIREKAKSKDCGKDGKRNGRNVWEMSVSRFRGAHFATFPEELPRRCILAATRPGDVVADVFAGSGTTGKVAMEVGRRCILLDRNYSGEGGYQVLARQRIGESKEDSMNDDFQEQETNGSLVGQAPDGSMTESAHAAAPLSEGIGGMIPELVFTSRGGGQPPSQINEHRREPMKAKLEASAQGAAPRTGPTGPAHESRTHAETAPVESGYESLDVNGTKKA
jgi:hypothetical protein